IVLPGFLDAVGGLLQVGFVISAESRQPFVAELVPGEVELEQAAEERAAMSFHPRFQLLWSIGKGQIEEGRVVGLSPLAWEVGVEEDAADDEGDGSDQVVRGATREPLTPPLNGQDEGIGFDLFALFRLHERSLLARAGGGGSF